MCKKKLCINFCKDCLLPDCDSAILVQFYVKLVVGMLLQMRSAEEMDQADVELRETILKVWPYTAKEKIDLLVPGTHGTQ